MTLEYKYLYIRLNEWHHLYLGLILTAIFGALYYFNPSIWYEVCIVISVFIAVDDIIQHMMQGYYLHKRGSRGVIHHNGRKVKFWFIEDDAPLALICFQQREGTLPSFLIHTILYHPRYLNIGKVKWIAKLTKFIDKLFGK